MVVTATAVAQIWICGRGCGKMEATAVTTRWQSELVLAVASEKAMASAIWKKNWRSKLGLQDLAAGGA